MYIFIDDQDPQARALTTLSQQLPMVKEHQSQQLDHQTVTDPSHQASTEQAHQRESLTKKVLSTSFSTDDFDRLLRFFDVYKEGLGNPK